MPGARVRRQENPPHVKSGAGTIGVHPRDDSGVRMITEADSEDLPDQEPPEELPPVQPFCLFHTEVQPNHW